ncbi:AraC family transcriptional regulator [Desulfosporosinus sp. OT]|uniref:AraC family transcriptional regulator n=1 Tax=Desulfosporosinus sp. OT TaxID=913865 RepID=UPI000223AB5D|nr:AraC family transcriptional regulator [Desulfosporosinus sp. OT]EGW41797.1 bacterial regulatory helix-turn-helix s, AraC family protein [Desulfosporosinus sp. OT]
MDWLDAMNRAVEYLEANLTEKLDIEKVAKIALSSPFHFQRMYHMITGVTIAEYVRRRRLTLAAQDILSGKKIIDVAYRYGYETPEAFTKAFGKMHGICPSAARELGANLKAYPKLSFHISIKGDKDMNYKIVDKGSFTVVGKQRRISLVDGENFIQGAKFWDDCVKDGSYQWISSKAGKLGVLGVFKDFGKDDFNYIIGVEEIKDTLPKGYVSATIPAATWAVFESVGALPEALVDIIRRIYSEWFPATGYQHDCCTPGLEVYPEGNKHSPNYRCEYWVPVKK